MAIGVIRRRVGGEERVMCKAIGTDQSSRNSGTRTRTSNTRGSNSNRGDLWQQQQEVHKSNKRHNRLATHHRSFYCSILWLVGSSSGFFSFFTYSFLSRSPISNIKYRGDCAADEDDEKDMIGSSVLAGT
jgi:hypothetical protein